MDSIKTLKNHYLKVVVFFLYKSRSLTEAFEVSKFNSPVL